MSWDELLAASRPQGTPVLLPQQGLEPCAPDVIGHGVHLVHGGLDVEAADDILRVQLVQVKGDSCYSRSLRLLGGGDVGTSLGQEEGGLGTVPTVYPNCNPAVWVLGCLPLFCQLKICS